MALLQEAALTDKLPVPSPKVSSDVTNLNLGEVGELGVGSAGRENVDDDRAEGL